MKEFFRYESPYRTLEFMPLTVAEKIIPLIVLAILIVLLIKFRNIFKRNDLLDKRVRVTIGIFFTVLYVSHYALRFMLYKFDTLILPFQLCSIAMFFAIFLIFTKNKTVYTFVLFTGVAGGLISMTFPVLGYDSGYYRYYQFYLAHGILVITPLYFMFVHGYIPKKKEVINSFLILQSIAIFMAIFNYYMNTDFMFLFLDQDKIEKFPAIANFGGIPLYLIWVEIAGISYFVGLYWVIQSIYKKTNLEGLNENN